tara:strand:+ start:219 stop:386 length:168 start_codon:yes stop_codon:yes gene_type:complete
MSEDIKEKLQTLFELLKEAYEDGNTTVLEEAISMVEELKQEAPEVDNEGMTGFDW